MAARPPDTGPGGAASAICLGFPAAEREVSRSLRRVRRLLAEMGLGDDGIERAELVLAEALNNVVEHACAQCHGAPVRLDIRHAGGHLDCLIRDRGAPMPGAVPPKGRRADPPVARDALPEGGFGWMLIRSLTDEISYRRDGSCNRLSLRIPVTPERPANAALGP